MKLSERLAQLDGDDSVEETEARPEPEQEPPAAGPKKTPRSQEPKAATAAKKSSPKTSPKVSPPRSAPRLTIDHQDDALEGLKSKVRAAVVKELGPKLTIGAVDEADLRIRLEQHLAESMRSASVTVSPRDRARFFQEMLADMLGWGPLEQLMEDPSVTEVMCNAHDEIWVEREGLLSKSDTKFANLAAYRQVVDRMLAVAGRRVDEASPMADGRLKDGSRINAIIPPLVVGEPVLTIRRFPEMPYTIADLIRMESVSKDAALFLEAAVRSRMNCLISGGTGTGKTTMLNVLSNFIPDNERVITIEDAAELKLEQPHVVKLEARPANIEGAGQVTIRDLVRNALRMRPDRIVVGEVRGGESLDMLQAMNTGHEGSLTTVHANSARDALSRVETMVLFSGLDLPLRAIREQIASALDIVVHLERRSDGRRVISLISEVQGREGDTITMQDIFTSNGGPLLATGLRPRAAERMKQRGAGVPATIFSGGSAPATAGKRGR